MRYKFEESSFCLECFSLVISMNAAILNLLGNTVRCCEHVVGVNQRTATELTIPIHQGRLRDEMILLCGASKS